MVGGSLDGLLHEYLFRTATPHAPASLLQLLLNKLLRINRRGECGALIQDLTRYIDMTMDLQDDPLTLAVFQRMLAMLHGVQLAVGNNLDALGEMLAAVIQSPAAPSVLLPQLQLV